MNGDRISSFIFLWASPVVILATYLLGYNDIIPVTFIVVSLYLLKKNRYFFSGVFIALSVSAKLSMLISIPFFDIFLSQ